MKTGHFYFVKLSKQEQKEFKENLDNDPDEVFEEYMVDEFISWENFITNSFLFKNTPQGYDYWEAISNRKID